MLKIVEIVSGINFGGVETLLLNYFKKMNLNDFSISIITHDQPNPQNVKQFEKLGIKVYKVTPKRINPLKNYCELKKIIQKIEPDIVHCHMSLSNYLPLFVAKKCRVKKRISHVHELAKSKNLVQKFFSKIIIKNANILMACSTDAAKYAYDTVENVIILPNAIEVSEFTFNEKKREKIRNQLKINEDEFVIGTVGRLVEVKNQKRLIELFAECYDKKKNIKLLIVGDGILKNELVAYAKTKKVQDNIYFIGNTTKVNLYYNAMDVFVMTSYFEGLGMALVEAQANGLSCVVSTGLPDESILNENVVKLNLEDSNEIWQNKILKNTKRVNNAKVLNSKFNLENSLTILEKIYRKSE